MVSATAGVSISGEKLGWRISPVITIIPKPKRIYRLFNCVLIYLEHRSTRRYTTHAKANVNRDVVISQC